MPLRRSLPLLLLVLLAGCADAPRTTGAITVDSTTAGIRITSPTTIVTIERSPYRLRFADRDGTILASEADGGGVFWERGATEEHLGDVLSEKLLPDGVALTVAAGATDSARVTVRFVRDRTAEVLIEPPAPASIAALGDRWQSPPDERIYGLSERLRDSPPLAPGVVEIPREDAIPVEAGGLDRRGERVAMIVTPTFAVYGPFFHSSRGYGLAVSGTSVGWFDLAHDDPEQIAFRFETGNAPESRVLRFHLFHGPEHATILDEYTAINGRPFVPPDWAFLHWRWRGELAMGDPVAIDGTPINRDVADDIAMYEQLGIPPGVYLFDRPVLAGEYGFARWEWDAQRLPNVSHMLEALRGRGYRLMMWSSLWACGSGPGDNGSDALALGFLAPGGSGAPHCDDVGGNNFILDPTTAAARDFWRERVRDFFRANGIQGVKLDRGEEHIPSEATDIWADGRTGREVRNEYPTLQAKLHHDAMAEAFPGDSLVFTRSAYTGTQQWAVVWGGDIPGSERFGSGPGTDLGLRSAIISQQRAAFLGYPIWGSDTGGYYEFKDRDVFARWIEFSAFSGLMEIGGVGEHAPWRMPSEPTYDSELIDIYRRYTRLRERLQPYLVTAARDAGATGLPLVRPLVFAFRDDPAVADLWDEYLLGPELLVAPVWRAGQRAREVYLPAGAWRGLWDESQRYDGPLTITVDVPLGEIPVFVRGDAPAP
jgi:alpha-D-xyloside xylohydrolase